MRKLIYIVLSFLLLGSCVGQRRHDTSLRRVQILLNDAPDSALVLLDSMEAFSAGFSRGTRMHWLLLRLSAQNKCDSVFRSDSLQLMLVGYFDHHGTPNERMTAHYLLGRAYSDMGEAPRALKCFLDAVSCADTTAIDCDYSSLFRVYGQIAMSYRQQCMPENELEAWKNYEKYALCAGDVYNSIRGREMTMGVYYDMGDTTACLRVSDQCHHMYTEQKMYQEAANVYQMAIYIHLLNGNDKKAEELMHIFENEAGVFDSQGNISKGREVYYYSKGLFYLHKHRNDSAEFYFRKLLDFHFNCDFQAYKGLLSLYNNKGNVDSISKYTALYEESVNQLLDKNQSEAMAQMTAVYDYHKMEMEAKMMADKMKKTKWRAAIFLTTLVFLLLLGCFYYSHNKKKKDKELASLGASYLNLKTQYELTVQEVDHLKNDKGKLEEEKVMDAQVMKSQIDELEKKYKTLSQKTKDNALDLCDIVKKFKGMASPKKPNVSPSSKDWKLLLDAALSSDNPLYKKIILSKKLIPQEIYLCTLMMLHFTNNDLLVLLNTSAQRLTNLKISANQKLFGEKTAKTLSQNLSTT